MTSLILRHPEGWLVWLRPSGQIQAKKKYFETPQDTNAQRTETSDQGKARWRWLGEYFANSENFNLVNIQQIFIEFLVSSGSVEPLWRQQATWKGRWPQSGSM